MLFKNPVFFQKTTGFPKPRPSKNLIFFKNHGFFKTPSFQNPVFFSKTSSFSKTTAFSKTQPFSKKHGFSKTPAIFTNHRFFKTPAIFKFHVIKIPCFSKFPCFKNSIPKSVFFHQTPGFSLKQFFNKITYCLTQTTGFSYLLSYI